MEILAFESRWRRRLINMFAVRQRKALAWMGVCSHVIWQYAPTIQISIASILRITRVYLHIEQRTSVRSATDPVANRVFCIEQTACDCSNVRNALCAGHCRCVFYDEGGRLV